MNREPRLQLYTEARCTSDRLDVAPIHGQRVAILDRRLADEGVWIYTVSENATSPIFSCFESELVAVDPLPLISDDEHMRNIISQTAVMRHSAKDSELRRILSERGCDPQECLLISCGQGFDVRVTLILQDGTIVDADYGVDPATQQATGIQEWEVLDYSDREIELCRKILSNDTAEFNDAVQRHFDRHPGERPVWPNQLTEWDGLYRRPT
ncbi:hypothetical protein N9Y42_08220 [Mariniblastus sp.]|nr:hypothetical protein [Mariniblastus sp.]